MAKIKYILAPNSGFKACRGQRGMALVGTMTLLFLLVALTLVGVLGVWTKVTSKGSLGDAGSLASESLRLTSLSGNALQALDVAESGIDYTRLWLGQQGAPPAYVTAFAPSTLYGANVSGILPPRACVNFPNSASSTSQFQVTIYPDITNAANIQKHYLIESIGIVGSEQVIIHAYVQEASLAKYAFLQNVGFGGFWASNNRYFDGPVHINSGPNQGALWRDGTNPLFNYTGNDAFSVSMPVIPFSHNTTATLGAPLTVTDWATVSAGGPGSLKAAQPVVNFPSNSFMQEYAALGLPIPNPIVLPPVTVPTATGATISAIGGVYIHGDVQQMTLSAVNSYEQQITLYQTDSVTGNSVVTTIVINPALNQTTQQVITTTPGNVVTTTNQTISSTTNGVIYCDGNIGASDEGGISGTLADNYFNGSTLMHSNSLTIASDMSHSINYDGNILTNTSRQQQTNSSGQPLYRDVTGNTTTVSTNNAPIYVLESQDTGSFLKHAGILGVISSQVNVNTHLSNASGTSQTSAWNQIEIDAATFTGNYLTITGWNANRPLGTMLNMGALDANYGAQPNSTDSTGAVTAGVYLSRTYDARLVNTPPPYFPTSGTQYDVISWQVVPTTVE